MISQVLELHGFIVHKAVNGQEAVQEVDKIIQAGTIELDLIVLDLQMPILNGYEACTQIKRLYSENSRNEERKGDSEDSDEGPNRQIP